MAVGKLVNFFALSSLAVLVCNLGVTPVTALSAHGAHMHRRDLTHGAVAKRSRGKRDNSKRCKTRSSTAVESSTAAAAPSSTDTPAATTTQAQASTSVSVSTSTSAAPAASSSSISSGSGGKIGIAWGGGTTSQLDGLLTSNVKYIYTWSETCPESSLLCCPMLWGDDEDRINRFTSTVVEGYATCAMGFNEINEAGQSNMDATTAAQKYKQYITPLKEKGYNMLIAPVTSSEPKGFDIMIDFMNQCSDCQIDVMPVHYYGTSADDMITYIEKWYNQFKLPIMITEFACQNYNTAYENNGQQCSESQVWEFYKKIIQFAESTDYVIGVFPFGFLTSMSGVNELDRMMSTDYTLTSLGASVVNLSFQ